MGQILSREDDDEHVDQDEKMQLCEDNVRALSTEEKPKRRQRQATSGVRSRKVKPAAHGRTRRSRSNPVTFDVRDY